LKPTNPDVLIIGAGPVGLTMAAELARFGITVRILDKASAPTDKSKALVVWPRTLELLDRSGAAAAFVDAGLQVTSANIITGHQQLAHIALNDVASPYPFALMLPQSDTERLLTQHLSTFDIGVERDLELTTFTQSPEGILATTTGPNNATETVAAKYLIGCDGAHSTVRHELGMQFTGDTLPSDWILADVHLAGDALQQAVTVAWHAEGILAIFPITDTRYRVIADVGPTPQDTPRPDPTLADVQKALDTRGPGGINASDPIWLATFHINERKVADYRSGRVFLAGDAAHIHSPAGGQGMNTGMQDACNLAWKLALVHRGICKPELLDSYSLERSAVGDEVLKGAGRLTRVAILRGEAKQSIRNHVASLLFGLSPIRHLAAQTLTELSIGYPASPLTFSRAHLRGTPAAGDRAPIRPNESPVGSGNTSRFALFAEPDDLTPQLLALYPNLLEQTLREPFHPEGLWLVRPDGYVALTAAEDDWPSVAAYLDKLSA